MLSEAEIIHTAALHVVSPVMITPRRPTRSDSMPITGRVASVVTVCVANIHPTAACTHAHNLNRVQREKCIEGAVQQELRRLRKACCHDARLSRDLLEAT
jgi:hypothetical protein